MLRADSRSPASARHWGKADDAETLKSFLDRLNFRLPPTISASTSPAKPTPPGTERPPFDASKYRTPAPPAVNTSSSLTAAAEGLKADTPPEVAERRQSFKEAVRQLAAQARGNTPSTTVSSTPASNGSVRTSTTASNKPVNKPSHSLPAFALPFTLRGSSLAFSAGGSNQPPLPPVFSDPEDLDDTPNASISKPNPAASEFQPDLTRQQTFEKRTQEALARQESINRHISELQLQPRQRNGQEKSETDAAHQSQAEQDMASKRAAIDLEKQRKAEEAFQAMLKAESDARQKAQDERRAKAAAEDEARRKAQEETRRHVEAQAAEGARLKAEAEERRARLVEQERLAKAAAEAEARQRALEETRRQAEEQARKAAAEAEAPREAQDEARRLAEETARKKAAAEAEARRKAEEEAHRQAEEQARKKAVEDARLKMEAEARRKAAEEMHQKQQAEARRKADEARIKAKEEAQKWAEEEKQAKAKEEARKRAEEERIKAEEEAMRRAEEQSLLLAEQKKAERTVAEQQEVLDNLAQRLESLKETRKDRFEKIAADDNRVERMRTGTLNILEDQQKRLTDIGRIKDECISQINEATKKLAEQSQLEEHAKGIIEEATKHMAKFDGLKERLVNLAKDQREKLDKREHDMEAAMKAAAAAKAEAEKVVERSIAAAKALAEKAIRTAPKALNGTQSTGATSAATDSTPAGSTTTDETAVNPPFGTSASRENVETEGVLKFTAWPKPAERPHGPAKVRRVQLTNLPSTSTVSSIQALIWGGRVEQIAYTPGSTSAWVFFMRAADAAKYLDETSNGIEVPGDDRIVWVESSKDPDPAHDMLRGHYDAGVTRCVRAIGVDEEWGMGGLTKLAAGDGRKVERVINGQNPSGRRTVEFRFHSIYDALKFRVRLANDEEWEHCNVIFAPDPCATAEGVHVGM
ncbi:hypothetical protein H2199_006419 [Coniosporium tulheliwenetii]|uniref:Uncharacterized protein n=1 Tax=Coniosporium tulheliwenetii TaxID=3383036 RepID=A0ACC2YWD8_9PEZI|nr:hypothetical protein H2199_006419 [Cladosporium sp. JES 115]